MKTRSKSVLGVGVLTLACNAVLGLEDVKLKKAGDGSGGSGGTSGAQGGSAGTSGPDAGGGGEATGGTAGSGTGGSGGRVGTDCEPGEYVQGTAGSDRICIKCSPGSYSSAQNAPSCPACDSGWYSADPGATECAEWSDCDPGTYVSQNGDAMRDRQCADCEGDTQTTIQNQSQCLSPDACQAGTEQTAPAQCMDCDVGTYCPGGETPGAPCPSGTWDDDEEPGTECAAMSVCPAGYFVSDDGSATMDRTCEPCEMGTFNTRMNAPSCTGCADGSFADMEGAQSCTPWTVCPLFYAEETSGSATQDRKCKEGGWTRQVGGNGQDYGSALAVDANGNVYVAGTVINAALEGQTLVGSADAYVMKFDGSGMLLWTRQFGTIDADYANGVAVDASGNVFVVGSTTGTLTGQASAGASDAFVVKYNTSGTLVWTQQFGTSLTDNARAVSVDASGNAYVVGETAGALTGQTSAGTFDAFVVKDDAAGTMVWARQLGTSSSDYGRGVSVTTNGIVYVAGSTNGALPTHTSAGAEDAFIARYSSSGTLAWSRQFGTVGVDQALAVSVDSTSGTAYIAGSTRGALSGQTSAGGLDAFVMKYDSGGTWQWSRQFGTGGDEVGSAVRVDWGGNAFVAGYTSDTLPGQTSAGDQDAFVMKYDSAGTLAWTRQFGSIEEDSASGVSADMAGTAYVAGSTRGELPGQTKLGNQDTFVKHIVP